MNPITVDETNLVHYGGLSAKLLSSALLAAEKKSG
jgi:hypothetical protein